MAEASTEAIAQQIRTQSNLTSLNQATALAASTKVAVPFAQWVKVNYPDSLESIMKDADEGKVAIPFSTIISGGDFDYTNYGSINLIDQDINTRTSGIFKAVLAKDWQVVMTLRTENEDYLTDNIRTSLMGKLQFDDSPRWDMDSTSSEFAEAIRFAMYSTGDFISLDLDGESDKVGQFTLKLGGVKYTIESPKNMDDEATVVVHSVYYYQSGHSVVNPDGTIQKGDAELNVNNLTIALVCGAGYHNEYDADGIEFCAKDEIIIDLDASFFDYLIFGGIGFLVLTVLGLVKRGA